MAKIAKPTTSFSKIAKVISAKAGRFGFGKFGKARFGKSDGFSKEVKNTTSFSKIAKP